MLPNGPNRSTHADRRRDEQHGRYHQAGDDQEDEAERGENRGADRQDDDGEDAMPADPRTPTKLG
jgi:hypothetical protein